MLLKELEFASNIFSEIKEHKIFSAIKKNFSQKIEKIKSKI